MVESRTIRPLSNIRTSAESVSGAIQQQQQQPMEQQQRPDQVQPIKTRKGKIRKKAISYAPPSKKAKIDCVGESIEEEQDESGFQSTLGESIYEDFDN